MEGVLGALLLLGPVLDCSDEQTKENKNKKIHALSYATARNQRQSSGTRDQTVAYLVMGIL